MPPAPRSIQTAAPAIATAAAAFDKAHVTAQTGVSPEVFDRLVQLLQKRTPSVVLSV